MHNCSSHWAIRKNGVKFFATSELLEQLKDMVWLIKVTNAVNHHWQKNNANKSKLHTNGQAKANEYDNND